MATHKLLVYWCNEGLESVFDLTDWERKKIWSTLKGEPAEDPPSMKMMMLRARVNSHRQYELYIIETEDITCMEMRKLFRDRESVQLVVDLIRERGTMLYSDHGKEGTKLIS